MRDTPIEVDRRYRAMVLSRAGAERLRMGCSMFAAARALALGGLRRDHPRASDGELRRLLFLRFYGGEFPPGVLDRILRALEAAPADPSPAAPPP
jgi:hypothetical protein